MSESRPIAQNDIVCFRDVPEYHDPTGPSQGAELSVGHVLDKRFVISEPISRSGMAVIYKAEDLLDSNKPVAIKVPHLQYESDPNFFERFKREEEIGRKLQHPYILKFISVSEKSRPYIVTEYLNGCTLSHLLDAMRPLPEKDAIRIASLVCAALQHMHEHGVAHRDLKPANIMVCRDRSIRLIDFGIATANSSRKITFAGFNPTMGTPDYMAPEQVTGQRTDERTDIYSLGAMLYETLTGQVPFPHENPWVAMTQRVTGDPWAPRKINPALSEQAEEIVLHAMQRNPADRYQTAAAMKADLDAPDKMPMTGYRDRLSAPRWKLGMRETPVIAGTLVALGFIAFQVLMFLFLHWHFKHH